MEKEVVSFKEFYKDTSSKLNKVINNYNNNLVSDKYGYLKDNLELFKNLNSDGKLVRGNLISLGYKMMGNSNIDYSLYLSLAYEIFQTSVLIHDDIIDNDNLRRGKETIHYANYKRYSKYNDLDSKKVSESIGICIGDYGFYEANKVIIDNYSSDKNFSNILSFYNDVVLKTIHGELIDVISSFDSKYNLNKVNIEDNVMLIYKLKTAYYTITGPLSLGMILGGSKEKDLNLIKEFGEKIGIAFQIQDDVLGIYEDMGKVVGSDIKEFKQTILLSYLINNKSEYLNELLKYYGKEDIDDNDINKVRDIFKESGAYDYSINLMNNLYDEGLDLINKMNITNEDKDILKGFVMYLKERKK